MKLSNRIHRDFQPLNITAGIRVLSSSSASPLTQSFDAMTGEYLPDRTLTPTYILPDISMVANDGSMNDASGNPVPYTNADLITSSDMMHWYVDGKPISEVFDAAEYTIETTGKYDSALGVNTRGMLTLKKNIPETESHEIYFDGYILDKRTGHNVHAVTKKYLLNTVAAGTDDYHIVCTDPPVFLYNPFMDKLLLFEWKRSRGLDTGTDTEDSVKDGRSFIHTWNFVLKGGTTTVDGSKYTVKLLDPNDNDNEIGVDRKKGVVELTTTSLTVDVRMFTSRSFKVAAYRSDKEGTTTLVATLTVTARTIKPDFDAKIVCNGGTAATDTHHSNMVKITTNSISGSTIDDIELECPDAYFDFVWKAVTASNTEGVEVGTGSEVTYSLASIGIANDSDNADYTEDVYGDFKEPLAVAEDDEGNALYDSYGNMLVLR